MAIRRAPSERLPLSEKICLVTNCGVLQGGPDAAEFQRQGASLILQTHDWKAAKSVLERDGVHLEPGTDEPRVEIVEADFGRPGVAESSIRDLVGRLGRVDVLVNNNAPPHIGKPLDQIDDEEWHEMFRLIVTELFYTTRAVLRRMIPARKGKIINIAAAGGIDPYPGPYTAYCAARGAIVTLTKALGREVAPYNIQVNAIA
jgi:3-oxoacyl-[acyl-carrier protein] reductase